MNQVRVFSGEKFAREKEATIKLAVERLVEQGRPRPKIASIVFHEDKTGQLYTDLKATVAQRVGIQYQATALSLKTGVGEIAKIITELNRDSTVTGVMIQKPTRKTWLAQQTADSIFQGEGEGQAFHKWWSSLTSSISSKKDVDGLHPQTLKAVQSGEWRNQNLVLPATARAVLEIIQVALVAEGDQHSRKLVSTDLSQFTILIIGRSDILAQPLFFELKNLGANVAMLGRADLSARHNSGQELKDADILISATGQPNLVNGSMVKDGLIAIDVGEPKPDFDFLTLQPKTQFITPVPGGVGPVTVISLLQNAVDLVQAR